MASLIAAIASFRPRVVTRRTLGLDALSERLARGTLVTRPIVRLVLDELCVEIERALRDGDAVSLPGLGRFGADVRMDGRMRPVVRVDPALRRVLSTVADFNGEITNRENLGLSTAEVVERWNEMHPDDPVG